MIGVSVGSDHVAAAREFFELFKTPWEIRRSDRHYDVLLICDDSTDDWRAPLVLVFNARSHPYDDTIEVSCSHQHTGAVAWTAGTAIHIGSTVGAVAGGGRVMMTRESDGRAIARNFAVGERTVCRIAYDILDEVMRLLCKGQTSELALEPSLDRHIDFVRSLIRAADLPFLEIPPVPQGYRFVACLTHDVDFVAMRHHVFDRTAFGFLYRATLGSVLDWIRGRRSLRDAVRNVVSALAVPLVHAGLVRDFFDNFAEYLDLETASTFFVIPFRNTGGTRIPPVDSVRRRVKYDIDDIRDVVRDLRSRAAEVSLHGIDAWHSSTHARAERERVVDRSAPIGVRMHWLLYCTDTPLNLERAGFDYDSTFGYNDAIGFRAGTSQGYRPLGCTSLIELPMNIQDSSLFYKSRMGLSHAQSENLLHRVIRHVAAKGGVLTLNWHQRSLGPERLWKEPYVRLLSTISAHSPWFATGLQAAAWVRKRRAVRFLVQDDGTTTIIQDCGNASEELPGVFVRVHQMGHDDFQDVTIPDGGSVRVAYDFDERHHRRCTIETTHAPASLDEPTVPE